MHAIATLINNSRSGIHDHVVTTINLFYNIMVGKEVKIRTVGNCLTYLYYFSDFEKLCLAKAVKVSIKRSAA